MNIPKKLIIYNFDELFNILNEIKSELNYEIEKSDNNSLGNEVFDLLCGVGFCTGMSFELSSL